MTPEEANYLIEVDPDLQDALSIGLRLGKSLHEVWALSLYERTIWSAYFAWEAELEVSMPPGHAKEKPVSPFGAPCSNKDCGFDEAKLYVNSLRSRDPDAYIAWAKEQGFGTHKPGCPNA